LFHRGMAERVPYLSLPRIAPDPASPPGKRQAPATPNGPRKAQRLSVSLCLFKAHPVARPGQGMPARIRKLQEGDVDGICVLWKEFAQMREGLTRSKILNEDAADYFFGY